MQLSYLTRFDHDCNRRRHRGGIGIFVTDLIGSYHTLMSVVAIGLIVIKGLTAKKKFQRLTRLTNQSCSSHQIVIHRNKLQQIESTRVSQSHLSQLF